MVDDNDDDDDDDEDDDDDDDDGEALMRTKVGKIFLFFNLPGRGGYHKLNLGETKWLFFTVKNFVFIVGVDVVAAVAVDDVGDDVVAVVVIKDGI